MEKDGAIKKQLLAHLKGGEAFMPVDKMLEEIQFERLGQRPGDLPYSFYELFYHIYFTQKDILKYCTEENYTAVSWPEDYWPEKKEPENRKDWDDLKADYLANREQLTLLILNSSNDLLDPVPSNPEHTLLREVLLVIEHTAYHSGQLLVVLRHLGLHGN